MDRSLAMIYIVDIHKVKAYIVVSNDGGNVPALWQVTISDGCSSPSQLCVNIRSVLSLKSLQRMKHAGYRICRFRRHLKKLFLIPCFLEGSIPIHCDMSQICMRPSTDLRGKLCPHTVGQNVKSIEKSFVMGLSDSGCTFPRWMVQYMQGFCFSQEQKLESLRSDSSKCMGLRCARYKISTEQ